MKKLLITTGTRKEVLERLTAPFGVMVTTEFEYKELVFPDEVDFEDSFFKVMADLAMRGVNVSVLNVRVQEGNYVKTARFSSFKNWLHSRNSRLDFTDLTW